MATSTRSVVGGGNSAAQAALQFARFAKRVTMVVHGDSLKAPFPLRLTTTSNIELLTDTEVTALTGDENLRAVTLTNRRTWATQTIETRWLFSVSAPPPTPNGRRKPTSPATKPDTW